MRRRQFISLLGGVSATSLLWASAARARRADRIQRIGVLEQGRADDPAIQLRDAAVRQELEKLGWFVGRNLQLAVDLSERYRLPAVYGSGGVSAKSGGLIIYNLDIVAQFRQTAAYLDRILKGEKAADLPVQQPTKFQYVINLKTAKALGLAMPLTMQAIADEVIE